VSGPAGDVRPRLRQILAEVTGRPELAGLPEDTALFGAGVGLDSLAGTLLLRRIKREFGVDVAAEDMNLDALATLGTLITFIAERAQG
jgi:acyl carrier protein